MNNEEKILQLLEQMNARQDKTETLLGQLQVDMQDMKADMRGMKADMNGMRSDIDGMKADISDMKIRVTNIEDRTERIEARVTKIELTQENTVVPNIRLLAEGHEVIQHQIKNISVIDRMQEDIDTLKAAVSYLSNELKAMKEAM